MPTQEQVANNPVRAYLDRVVKVTGLTLTEVARKSGVSPSTLTRFMATEREGTMRKTTLLAIEQNMRVPLPPELTGAASSWNAPTSPIAADRVPLFSLYAFQGGEADFLRNESPTDSAPRLAGIGQNQMAYALRMPDGSMEPWRRPNELVYVDPTRFVDIGDHALVEMTHPTDPDHPRSVFRIRRLVARQRDGSVRLASYSGDTVETVTRGRLVQLHRILEWSEAALP